MYPVLTLEALEEKLQARFEEGFLTLGDLPYPSDFKDMERATERIVQAIRSKEQIVVVGDYDVDGVTSTTLIKLFFDEIAYPVEWIIPNRFRDGYGLSPAVIERIGTCDLIITVDNGISAVEAAKRCKEQGIDLIITDHHLLPPRIPEAYAIINQKQPECHFPYSDVCGAQIAWYLIASLRKALDIKIDMIDYMGLTAIAIIADMMPLRHINRTMVIAGIQSLNKHQRPCIKAFLEYHDKRALNTEDIAYFLAPLINSAGRMEDASHAVSFLSATNIYDARVRLERLIAFNTARKATEQEITDKALAKADPDDAIIVVEGEGWHEGVVGIVASRVARYHEKPAIVLSNNGEGKLKGSGRSFGACDLFTVTDRCRSYLEKFGGHQAAIGLSLASDRLESFREALQRSYREENYTHELTDPDIVGELRLGDISFALTALIQRYAPYGEGNPTPKFISKDVEILQADRMGKGGEHLRFTFAQEGITAAAVQFKTKENYEVGSSVDVVYTVSENHFRGRVTLQLMVEKVISV